LARPVLLARPSPLVAPSQIKRKPAYRISLGTRDAAQRWTRPPSPVATLFSGRRTIAQRSERPASPLQNGGPHPVLWPIPAREHTRTLTPGSTQAKCGQQLPRSRPLGPRRIIWPKPAR